jgi:hypothetical protein
VAIAVAAEDALRVSLDVWADELTAAIGEAAVMIEAVAAHELAHAITADIDGDLQAGEAAILRALPAAVGSVGATDAPERTARDHGPAWAAGIVILSRRCMRYRPGARHRWHGLLDRDLQARGIDAEAVAVAVGDVADEQPLRELLSPQGATVARVAQAIPSEAERAALIAALHNTTPADLGHVAPVAAGVAAEE